MNCSFECSNAHFEISYINAFWLIKGILNKVYILIVEGKQKYKLPNAQTEILTVAKNIAAIESVNNIF